MSVMIRLTRMGKRGERKFRVVAQEKRSRRDGKPIDTLGWYEKGVGFEKKEIDKKKYEAWLSKGAKPSITVEKLMK